MAKPRRKPQRRPPQRRPPRRQPDGQSTSLVAQVSELLGALTVDPLAPGWSPKPLEALPDGDDELMDVSTPAFDAVTSAVRKGSLSLQGMFAVGYAAIGAAEVGSVPDWLRSDDSPIDALDILFYGAAFPHQLRNPAEFGNARDAWLDLLDQGPYRAELARFAAAALDVSVELDAPLDDDRCWLGLMTRLHQAGIGARPVAAGLLPGRALFDARAVYGPNASTAVAASDPQHAQALVSFLATPVGQVRSGEDALRAGLAVLAAALLDGVTDPDRILLAGAPMYVGDPDIPTTGPDSLVQAADVAEAELNELLSRIDHPHERVAAHPPQEVQAAVDALPAPAILGALRIGLEGHQPRGTSLRQAVVWALGLPAASPLLQVTDALLVGDLNSTGLELLAQVCAQPGLSEEVPQSSRVWRGTTGVALLRIGLAAGLSNIGTTAGTVVQLDSAAGAMVGQLHQRFEERFGRSPRPDDPLFFDPDEDEPTPISEAKYAGILGATLAGAGVSDLTIRTCAISGLNPPPPHGRYAEDVMYDEWYDARAQAAAELGLTEEEAQEQERIDALKVAQLNAVILLVQMAEDDDFGASIVTGLRAAVAELENDDDAEMPGMADVAEVLRAGALLELARDLPSWSVPKAEAAARRWGDAALAREVRELGLILDALPASDHGEDGFFAVEWPQVPATACLVAVALANH